MHTQLVLAVVLVAMASLGAATAQERSECETSCGNVTIAFPFGSTERCYHSRHFLVTCNDSVPHFGGNFAITNMSINTGELEIMMSVTRDCYNTSGRIGHNSPSLTLEWTSKEFWISTKNRFVTIGCDTYAIVDTDVENEFNTYGIATVCSSVCSRYNRFVSGSCSGAGCCQAVVPEGMSSFEISLGSYNNHTNITDFNPCSYAFFVQHGKFNFSTTYLKHFDQKKMPMLLDWAIGNVTCDIAKKDMGNFLCKGNSECDKDYCGPGYRCRCSKGYEGNPYIANDCKDINECAHQNGGCQHKCINTVGGYECKCKKGYSRDRDGSSCNADPSFVIKIVVGASSAAIFLLVLVFWLYFGLQKYRLMMLKEKFFRKNGGIMLQQRISGDGGSHNQAKVFTTEELKKATNNYDESKIIGKGGFGTVFKGVLPDSTTVAVKKSKLVDQTQMEQFVNEVVILSQINHRNVVRLIGCCLETEVPLLVYEFIPNGTLSDHIHNKSKSLALTWDIRLRIATETAGALSYLHSAASVPIVHRDIKPTNILLDEGYVAKVSDFGASRLIPKDQTELATIVQGTVGYLDPEYLHTSQLTDKSDVYSFGVLLAELFTGKKALSFSRPEKDRNLAMYFLSCLKEGRLLQVLDEHFQLDEVPNAIINVSRVAERCLRVKGDERPNMKEVAIELEGILASMTHKHKWVQGTSNEEESEHLLKEQTRDIYEYTNRDSTCSGTFDNLSQLSMFATGSGR